MCYIKFYGNTSFYGTDYEEYEMFENSIVDSELDDESSSGWKEVTEEEYNKNGVEGGNNMA